MPMPQLAQRMSRAKPSAIMVIADKAKTLKAAGRSIVNFSIGVPNFLPGEHVYEAVRAALKNDSGAYGSNRGRDDLLDAFLAHLKDSGLSGYTRANLATGIGAKQVLYNLAEALLDPGDEIVFPTPYWTSYMDIAEILGAKITLLPCPPEQNYKLMPAQLDKALASKPKVFLFNNPSNPTGMVYTRDEIATIADVLAKHPDTWIIADDIYNRMVFDGVGYHNVVNFRPELRDLTRSPPSLTCWPSIRIPGSSPTTSTTAWCSTAWAITTSSTSGRNCASAPRSSIRCQRPTACRAGAWVSSPRRKNWRMRWSRSIPTT